MNLSSSSNNNKRIDRLIINQRTNIPRVDDTKFTFLSHNDWKKWNWTILQRVLFAFHVCVWIWCAPWGKFTTFWEIKLWLGALWFCFQIKSRVLLTSVSRFFFIERGLALDTHSPHTAHSKIYIFLLHLRIFHFITNK